MLFLTTLLRRALPAAPPAVPTPPAAREDRPAVPPRAVPPGGPTLVARWELEDGRPVCRWVLRYPRLEQQRAARA